MKTVSVVLSAVLAVGPAVSWAEEAAEPAASVDARLTAVEGEVTVFPHDQPEDGVPGEEGMPLEAGDRVRTGAESRAEVGLDAESVIDLGPGTDFTVARIEGAASSFFLTLGSLVAKIKTLAAGRALAVETPFAVASVRGTEFGVEVVGAEETSHVGVFDEGKVSVTGPAGGETLLEANQETSVAKGRRPGAVRPLERLERHRQRLLRVRKRREALRRIWKRLTPTQRREFRRRRFERLRDLRRRIREKRRDNKRGRRGQGPRR